MSGADRTEKGAGQRQRDAMSTYRTATCRIRNMICSCKIDTKPNVRAAGSPAHRWHRQLVLVIWSHMPYLDTCTAYTSLTLLVPSQTPEPIRKHSGQVSALIACLTGACCAQTALNTHLVYLSNFCCNSGTSPWLWQPLFAHQALLLIQSGNERRAKTSSALLVATILVEASRIGAGAAAMEPPAASAAKHQADPEIADSSGIYYQVAAVYEGGPTCRLCSIGPLCFMSACVSATCVTSEFRLVTS